MSRYAASTTVRILAVVGALATLSATPAAQRGISWREVQSGVELGTVALGNNVLYVVRIDPVRAKMTAALASEGAKSARTAGEWCRASHMAVAINLGMFQSDGRSNVGYLRHGNHLNNPRWNAYAAVLALNFTDPAAAKVLWIDRDPKLTNPKLGGYDVVVQNLRLITRDRRNVWAKSERRWSEAAIAVDSRNRLLFLFSRAPYSMREFNELILHLPLDIAGAMHVEGGPEASLSVHAGGIDLDLAGSFETGFWPNDTNREQWPIPNVLGVLREK